jgi:hypothetical protein
MNGMGAVWGVLLSIVALLSPVLGVRGERTVEQIRQGTANECRRLGRGDACEALDGRRIAAVHMAEYEQSWTHRALTLQRQLDDAVPLARSLIPHTHNSFNASTYKPTLTNQDPNQVYSMTDQLRMDIRAIEMDIHWVPSRHGNKTTGYKAVVLCHGQVQQGVHVGCTNDRWFPEGLDEFAAWMHRPENANEVVLLYLENNLDGNLQAHDIAAQELADHLGNLVARPPAGQPCAPIDTSTSAAALRAVGHRVLIVGNCGPGAWGTWVHERGNASTWVESGSGPGDDYPGLNGCAAERARTGARHAIVRWYEDSTWLTAMVDGESGQLTTTEATAMAKCGATLIGFDQLEPSDPRLPAIVWSWAVNAPAAAPSAAACAASAADTRFHDEGCGGAHAFACSTGPNIWNVTAATGPWANGAATCAAEHPGSTFAVPANGWENSLLRTAAGNATVWLHYADLAGNGSWVA